MKKNIVILLGLPGSGKGTQGEIIAKELAIPHISTGEIFRRMVNEENEESKLLASYMSSGKLIPSDLVNKTVRNFILSDMCKYGCVLDGYPRTLEQAEYFIENIEANITTIFFDIAADDVIKRITGRVSCSSCNKIYNLHFDKPKKKGVCNECGGTKLIARDDDNSKTVLARIEEYKNNTLPVVAYYENKSKFFTVKAGKSKEKVKEEMSEIIKKI